MPLFDHLTPGPVVAANTVPVPYDGLNFTSFIYQNAGTVGLAQGVVPNSGAIYIANGPLGPTRTPGLSIKGTTTKSFDLQSFFYGCLIATETGQAQLATSCTFSVSGVLAGSGKAVAPVSFAFKPSSLTAAAMLEAKFDSAFSGLQSATVTVTSSGATVRHEIDLFGPLAGMKLIGEHSWLSMFLGRQFQVCDSLMKRKLMEAYVGYFNDLCFCY